MFLDEPLYLLLFDFVHLIDILEVSFKHFVEEEIIGRKKVIDPVSDEIYSRLVLLRHQRLINSEFNLHLLQVVE